MYRPTREQRTRESVQGRPRPRPSNQRPGRWGALSPEPSALLPWSEPSVLSPRRAWRGGTLADCPQGGLKSSPGRNVLPSKCGHSRSAQAKQACQDRVPAALGPPGRSETPSPPGPLLLRYSSSSAPTDFTSFPEAVWAPVTRHPFRLLFTKLLGLLPACHHRGPGVTPSHLRARLSLS